MQERRIKTCANGFGALVSVGAWWGKRRERVSKDDGKGIKDKGRVRGGEKGRDRTSKDNGKRIREES